MTQKTVSKTTVTCDRCNAEGEPFRGPFANGHTTITADHSVRSCQGDSGGWKTTYDLCATCQELFLQFMDGK
jgi:hypothetical protein